MVQIKEEEETLKQKKNGAERTERTSTEYMYSTYHYGIKGALVAANGDDDTQ